MSGDTLAIIYSNTVISVRGSQAASEVAYAIAPCGGFRGETYSGVA